MLGHHWPASKTPLNVGPSLARQRNAILMAFRWRAKMARFYWSLNPLSPHHLKQNVVIVGPTLTNLLDPRMPAHALSMSDCLTR